jgi:hypothetical protein
MIKDVYRSSCKVQVILVRFYCNLNFLDRFSKNNHVKTSMKIPTLIAGFFYADGQTDTHDEANIRFSQFCEGA